MGQVGSQPMAGMVAQDPMYEEFLKEKEAFEKYKKKIKEMEMQERVKGLKQIFPQRRTTLVMRRLGAAEAKRLAPDQDVLAYIDIYTMREAVTPEGRKIQVSDEEIAAFLRLEEEYKRPPTLEELAAKVQPSREADPDDAAESAEETA